MKIAADIYSNWPLSRIHTDWAALMAQDYRLSDMRFRMEVVGFAKQMMRKAGDAFKRIADELTVQGYQFASPAGPLIAPDHNIADKLADFQSRNIFVPIALEAWVTEIGTVNLMGSHPEWSRPGYVFDDDTATTNPLHTDAFVCEVTASYLDYLYDEWQSLDANERLPFRIDFSPDHLHKANISGGPPYQVETNVPTIDSLVLNERHCTSFVGLVRLALRWGGFPGFEVIGNEGRWSTIQPPVI
jgi:hypothetical protein